MSISYQF